MAVRKPRPSLSQLAEAYTRIQREFKKIDWRYNAAIPELSTGPIEHRPKAEKLIFALSQLEESEELPSEELFQ